MTIMCYIQVQYLHHISIFYRISPWKFPVPSSASPGKVPSAVVFAPSACAAARRRETPNPRPGGETPREMDGGGPPW